MKQHFSSFVAVFSSSQNSTRNLTEFIETLKSLEIESTAIKCLKLPEITLICCF